MLAVMGCSYRSIRLCGDDPRPYLPHGVTEAHSQNRLGGILQDIDDQMGVGLEVKTLAVTEQVKFGVVAHDFREALAEFAIKKAQYLADALQGESLAA